MSRIYPDRWNSNNTGPHNAVTRGPTMIYDPINQTARPLEEVADEIRRRNEMMGGPVPENPYAMQSNVISMLELVAMRVYQARPDLRPGMGMQSTLLTFFDHISAAKSGDKAFVFLLKDGVPTVLEDERAELFPSDQLIGSLLILLP